MAELANVVGLVKRGRGRVSVSRFERVRGSGEGRRRLGEKRLNHPTQRRKRAPRNGEHHEQADHTADQRVGEAGVGRTRRWQSCNQHGSRGRL